MSLEWPPIVALARDATKYATDLEYAAASEDSMAGVLALGKLSRTLQEAAAELALMAVHEGATQRAVADALGVPVSTLTGAKAEAARIARAR